MNENAKKWVEALRSGNYKQTTETLSDEDGYCCLGVACVLYEEETGDELPKWKGGYYKSIYLNGEFSCVKEWLGLRSYCGGDQQNKIILSNINDSGATFNEIADIIESEEGLFIKGDI